EGVIAAQQAAGSAITVIAGVEISVTWQQQTVHIVGLNIDLTHEPLQQGLTALRQYRQRRAERIGEKLAKAGINDAYQGAKNWASSAMIGRVHFAQFLVQQGYAKSISDVFKRFLIKNKPGYVASQWVSLAEALRWIHDAGGQAVIAHPLRYKMTTAKLKRLLTDFTALGGEGVEVVTGRSQAIEIEQVARLAKNYGLLASCGSDFHSPDNPWVELGRLAPLPTTVTPIWHNWHINSTEENA
ncbi:MAG TPA: phosphatase, partial [Gammaproteobacteria bacterium]|nr:phosphatase [Gammaproteobacteria bacterium]